MRYLTILSAMAIFLWSMIFSSLGFGQLEYNQPAVNNFELDVSDLIDGLSSNLKKYKKSPFYRAFMIYGDGHFDLLNDVEIRATYDFDRQFYYENEYPGIVLLLERKTDDTPGFDDQFYYPDGGTGVIDVNGGTINGGRPPLLGNVHVNLDPGYRIITGTGRIGIDYSHNDETDDYLESDKLVAFPIAYKPIADESNEIIIFYFDEMADGSNNFDSDNGLPFEAYLPHYDRVDRTVSASFMGVQKSNIGYFDKMIVYEISSDEERFKDLLPAPPPPNPQEELRWFPLIKSSTLTSGVNYSFLAIMYGQTFNGANYQNEKAILGEDDLLPDSITVQSGTYAYEEAVLLEVTEGEPDDPNELKIVDICRCDDEYHVVKFRLEFCNVSEYTSASGATIVLNDIFDVFSCIEFESSDSLKNEPSFVNYKCCNTLFNGINSVEEDKRFCLKTTGVSDLMEGDNYCRNFYFSAKINSEDLHLLYQDTVFEYCVFLHSVECKSLEITDIEIEMQNSQAEIYSKILNESPKNVSGFIYKPQLPKFGEVCGYNCVLNLNKVQKTKTKSSKSGNTREISKLVPNSVWKNRTKKCKPSNNCCIGGSSG
jgi:hypothetical protein